MRVTLLALDLGQIFAVVVFVNATNVRFRLAAARRRAHRASKARPASMADFVLGTEQVGATAHADVFAFRAIPQVFAGSGRLGRALPEHLKREAIWQASPPLLRRQL